jgi:hypothetical protein
VRTSLTHDFEEFLSLDFGIYDVHYHYQKLDLEANGRMGLVVVVANQSRSFPLLLIS